MADEPSSEAAPYPTATPEAPDAREAPPRPSVRRRILKWTFFLLGLPIIVFIGGIVLWGFIALHWTYSEGDRAGYVQKISKKGWVCKTYEGELLLISAPGTAQERWAFTVRDDSIAATISSLMGKSVTLHYAEHPNVPTSCFGETNYYVTGVRQVAGQ